jgi:hypothetical protein
LRGKISLELLSTDDERVVDVTRRSRTCSKCRMARARQDVSNGNDLAPGRYEQVRVAIDGESALMHDESHVEDEVKSHSLSERCSATSHLSLALHSHLLARAHGKFRVGVCCPARAFAFRHVMQAADEAVATSQTRPQNKSRVHPEQAKSSQATSSPSLFHLSIHNPHSFFQHHHFRFLPLQSSRSYYHQQNTSSPNTPNQDAPVCRRHRPRGWHGRRLQFSGSYVHPIFSLICAHC